MSEPKPIAPTNTSEDSLDFIRQIVQDDLRSGKHSQSVTRFPPEPNGYLHIGHAKSICLNFGIAEEFHGVCHLRFDDTNPTAEEVEYVESIQDDVRWLGFEWKENLYFASDYFERLYRFAEQLIERGKAFVCDLSSSEIDANRGAPTRPGVPSPFRDRSVEENLDLFRRMRAGEFDEGSKTLRAKIDMASPNLHMRDPVIYRIKKATHHRTGDAWTVYPMYDFTHCLSDAIEGITHSLCTLEFEVHRPLYDWVIAEVDAPSVPRQIEFSRLKLTHTVLSKRKLLELIRSGHVDGWDDPRLPTIRGLKRRGFTPESIRAFCRDIGITKYVGSIDFSRLEQALRQDLNRRAQRRLAVLDPIKVILTNYPEDTEEALSAVNNPEDPDAGVRDLTFSRELWIDRADFMEEPPKKFFRLAPGKEVRLKYAYVIRCDEVIKNEDGEIVELRCAYDPDTKSGVGTSTKKVKGTIHWVNARDSIPFEVRAVERLFAVEDPDEEAKTQPLTELLNPESLHRYPEAQMEASMGQALPEEYYQFERLGYFSIDAIAFERGQRVINRSVSLKDSWKKATKTN